MLVLVEVLKTRCIGTPTLTINDVNNFLDDLYLATDADEKSIILTKVIKISNYLEQKWLMYIVLRELKIGVSHYSILNLFNKKANEVYSSTSSLLEVCNFIQNPSHPKYQQTLYRINQPIKPMLAAKLTLKEIMDNFMNTPALVETKYDGERIQCHYNEGQIKFFTRNAVDYTSLYGPKLSDLLSKNIKAKCAILDGEICVWDKVHKKFSKFGQNKTIALSKNNAKNENEDDQDEEEENNSETDTEKDLIYMIFDIIYLVTPAGKEYGLQDVTLPDRKNILSKVLQPVSEKIEIVEGKRCNSIEDIFNYFNVSIENQEEGIIIKKLDSTYKLDDRSNDWVKMKCDYIDSLVDTLDLVIVGAYYGEGKRVKGLSKDWTDGISTFLMGVIKHYDKENPKNSLILPIAKAGNGYTQNQLETLRSRLRNLWKKYDYRIPPKLFGNWIPALKERPDFYIENIDQSIVLEIKAAEIMSTEVFPTRLTLRFPRVVKIRFDKEVKDAMQFEEVLKFYQNSLQHNHLLKTKRRIDNDDLEDIDLKIKSKDKNDGSVIAGKESKLIKKRGKYTKLLEDFKDTDTRNVKL